MIIYNKLKIKKEHKKAVVAIGNFDGLHLGHQKVLKEAKKKAKKNKLKFGLITFEPIPTMFFNNKLKNHRINSLKQKYFYLKKLKLDFILEINFNNNFSNLSAEQFIEKIIYKKINSSYIYVSKNFRFGKYRTGNIKTLKKYEKNYSYQTIITKPFKKNNKIISSSIIRKKILKGNLTKLKSFLGRNWSIEGKVIRGEQRGRKIGFPTCNIEIGNYILPKLGVYSVNVKSDLFYRKGIANIGHRPTFSGKRLLLEVNIFGINSNLYKKTLNVSFVKFIRKEKKFKGIVQLKQQIKKDIVKAKK